MPRLLALCLLLCPLLTWGQIYFNNRYPVAPGLSLASAMLLNGNGYVAVGKASLTTGSSRDALLLAFFDSTGQLLRTRFFERARARSLYSGSHDALIRTRDGGMAMAGDMIDSTGTHCGIFWRFNAQGDTLWTRLYYGPFDVQMFNDCQLPNGDFILTGQQYLSASGSTADALVMRTDSLGRIRWRRTYHIQPRDAANRPVPTRDGGLLVTGTCVTATSSFNRDWLLLKLDSTGRRQWHKVFGGPYSDGDGPLLPTSDGGYLAAGAISARTVPVNQSLIKVTLLKLDSTGQVQWERRYNPQGIAVGPVAMRALSDGTYLLAGQGRDTVGTTAATGSPVGFMLNVCANGDSLWHRTYKGPGTQNQHYLRNVQVTPDGGFVGTGFLFPGPPAYPTEDIWLFKTDRYGYLQAGGAPPTATCPVVGLPKAGPATGFDVQLYPMPSPTGRFTLGMPSPACLTVTDVLGRLVYQTEAREPETQLDLSHQPSGLYLLRLTWPDGRTLTRKLLR